MAVEHIEDQDEEYGGDEDADKYRQLCYQSAAVPFVGLELVYEFVLAFEQVGV